MVLAVHWMQERLFAAAMSAIKRPDYAVVSFDVLVVNRTAERAAAHLPEHALGPLGPMDDANARRLRAQLLNRLNR